MTEEEVLREALVIAREIVAGAVTPLAGAARIWTLSSENSRACFDELKGFVAAASQWDEAPERREELSEDARHEAEALVARHSTH